MADPFSNRVFATSGPAADMVPVTPNDAADLTDVAVSLYIETGGALVIDTVRNGDTRTINVADFSILPVAVRKVHAAGIWLMDQEQDVMTHTTGQFNRNGLRVYTDETTGQLTINREELGTYADFAPLPGAPAVPSGQWVDIQWDTLLSDDPTVGYCKVWMDGVLVLNATGTTVFNAADILAQLGLTLTGNQTYDVVEVGITALTQSKVVGADVLVETFEALVL